MNGSRFSSPYQHHRAIRAADLPPFGLLMKEMTEREGPSWPWRGTAEFCALIERELVVLKEQELVVDRNSENNQSDDLSLEALVRIAALARFAAGNEDLAFVKGVSE